MIPAIFSGPSSISSSSSSSTAATFVGADVTVEVGGPEGAEPGPDAGFCSFTVALGSGWVAGVPPPAPDVGRDGGASGRAAGGGEAKGMVFVPVPAGGGGGAPTPPIGRGGGGAPPPTLGGGAPTATVGAGAPVGRTVGGALRSGMVGAPVGAGPVGRGAAGGGGAVPRFTVGTGVEPVVGRGIDAVGGVPARAVGGGGGTGGRASEAGALGRSVIRTVSFFRGTADVLIVGGFGGDGLLSLMLESLLYMKFCYILPIFGKSVN
jgi:hypothetical protein